MIRDVTELLRLLDGDDPAGHARIVHEEADSALWDDAIEQRPESRHLIVRNKALPEATLRRLAADPDPDIRSEVARKGRLPVDLFSILASDPAESVRDAIVHHRKTPRDVLERLREDATEWIRDCALERLGQAPSRPRGGLGTVYFEYLQSAPPDHMHGELERIARHLESHPEVRVCLVGHASELGATDENRTLAEARALECQKHLVRMGVAPDRLSIDVGAPEGADSPMPEQRRVVIWSDL